MTGQVLGHYRVLEQIGTGGMGEVYRARDERLGRDVALKLVHPSSAKDQDRLRRFELEARSAASLNHPNIVAVYDIGFHDGMPFIVTELLEGETLRERIARGRLSVRDVSDYSLLIIAGLMVAHEKHIVHRDLKPENLFITKDNRIKILDFGIAKLIHPEAMGAPSIQEMTTQTKMGSVLGTVAYMSPEQLRARPVDARSDIFSLGAIMYEMLTGLRAWFRPSNEIPGYRRLTYELGTVYAARFAPDGRSVIYEAAWNDQPARLFSTVSTSVQAQVLGASDAHLLAVSRLNELALQLHGKHGTFLDRTGGTLRRSPLGGGSPPELLEGGRSADWGPKRETAGVTTLRGPGGSA